MAAEEKNHGDRGEAGEDGDDDALRSRRAAVAAFLPSPPSLLAASTRLQAVATVTLPPSQIWLKGGGKGGGVAPATTSPHLLSLSLSLSPQNLNPRSGRRCEDCGGGVAGLGRGGVVIFFFAQNIFAGG